MESNPLLKQAPYSMLHPIQNHSIFHLLLFEALLFNLLLFESLFLGEYA